jgi:oligopeptide/dipeptide ABC transporter ATP-binding protein
MPTRSQASPQSGAKSRGAQTAPAVIPAGHEGGGSPTPILAAVDVNKFYVDRSSRARRRKIRAVDGVSVTVERGRSVGIAGESGSGKTTLMRLLLRLESPTSGSILYNGQAAQGLSGQALREYRRSVQAVFQNPISSLDPRHDLWKSMTEPAAETHPELHKAEAMDLARRLLEEVGLPAEYVSRRPHQISGGEGQRVAIARALSCEPEVVLLDEPVTSLDVSVRGRVLELLADRGESRGVTYVVVSHDVTALNWLTDYMYVMYRGLIVEDGPTQELLTRPLHPYTELLVRAGMGAEVEQAQTAGPPRPARAPTPEIGAGGCPYQARCPLVIEECRDLPELSRGSERGVRCHVTSKQLSPSP